MATQGTVVEQGIEAAFSKDELSARQVAARQQLADRNVEVMIVTGPENIFYLTGQQTPGYYAYQALLLPVDGEPVAIVRQLELNNLVANSYLENIRPYLDGDDPIDVTVGAINDLGWSNRKFAIDERGWFLPIAVYKALVEKIGPMDDASRAIEALRAVKSPAEISKIEKAATYVDAGMRAGFAAIKAGATENDIVGAMMGAAIVAGSEYVGMEPLMACGTRCGIPHGTWRRNVIGENDPVFLEQSAAHDRYHATLMRSAWMGTPPDTARRMMDCCLEALQAALDATKPGATCADVHRACQAVVDAHGFTEAFKKRTGYSVGISFAPDWGEGNVLSLFDGVDTEIVPGMVFHMPPALRIYGEFTVGVSETAVVTETGCRTLSTLKRDLALY